MTDRGMVRVWLPDEVADRVRLAASARGQTLQQTAVRLVLEGLEQLRRAEKREHSAANRARRARSCEQVTAGHEQQGFTLHGYDPGSPAPGAGRHDVEPSGSQDVVTPHRTRRPLTCR